MAQIDGQLLKAQFENFTGIPTTGMAPGRFWADITNPTAAVPSYFDGTNTQRLLSTANFQNLLTAYNLGFTTSVAANALTINLLGNNLQAPSVSNPIYIPFRDATAANGDTVSRAVVAPLSITIPSGATLGLFSAVTQYLYLWAVDNAGAVTLAVSGSWRFCNPESIQSTTAITSGATGNKVLYSSASLTNKAVRLLARFTINQTTIGTWATTPTETCIYNGTPFVTPVPEGITFTDLAPTFSADMAPCTNTAAPYFRIGNRCFITAGFFTVGTTGASPVAQIILPAGINIDYREISQNIANSLMIGNFVDVRAGNIEYYNIATCTPGILFADGSTVSGIFLSFRSNGSVFLPDAINNITAAGNSIAYKCDFPVREWACY